VGILAMHTSALYKPQAELAAGPMQRSVNLDYRPDIDGLRAVAVAGVVAYHAAPLWVRSGYTGVDIFFVISGFLITGIILRELNDGCFSLLGFYARRIRRLFPALIAVLAATLALGWFYLLPHEFESLGKHITAGSAYFINFTLKRESGYFDIAAELKPLLHLWSLAVEEQFYLLWPLLLMALTKRTYVLPVLCLVTAASLTASVVAVHKSPAAAFYLPQYRIWELSSGGLLAYASLTHAGNLTRLRERRVFAHAWGATVADAASCAGLALIIAALFGLGRDVAFPGAWALIPVCGALLTIAAGSDAFLNRFMLARKSFVLIGLISYPLYLWHWPLLSFSAILGYGADLKVRIALVAIAIVLAIATYRFIERPLRQAALSTVSMKLLGTSLIFGLFGILARHSLVGPRLNAPWHQDISTAINDWKYPSGLTKVVTPSGLVLRHSGSSSNKVLYFGDSNIEQYWPRVQNVIGREASTSVVFATTGGCAPIPGVHGHTHPNCNGFARSVEAYARSADIQTVVLGASWVGYFLSTEFYMATADGTAIAGASPPGDLAYAALEKMIRQFRTQGKIVWLILAIPSGVEVSPLRKIHRSADGSAVAIQTKLDRAGFETSWRPIHEKLVQLARSNGAGIIDPMDHLCDSIACSGQTADGNLIYKDGAHLRASFVRDHATFIDQTLSGALP
jgi:peptidoglycan/LPS O-acetylase OafA/YrhL